MLVSRTLPLAVLLTAPLLAQEKTAPTKAPPITAIMLTTTDVMAGTAFLGRFDPEAELPDITDEQHYRLVLTSDGKIRSTVEDSKSGYLNAKVHVPGVMKLFAKQIDENWELAADSMIVGLVQMGFSTKNAAKLVKQIRAFPEQIAGLEFSLSGHPQNELKGLVVHLRLEPAPGSWLAKMHKSLRPNAQGAPVIPIDAQGKKAMMTAAVALDAESYHAILAPVLDLGAAFGAKTKKQLETNRSMLTKMMAGFGGAFSGAGDPFGGDRFQAIGTLRDAKGYAALLISDAHAKYMDLFAKMSPLVESEYTPIAFEHDGVKVSRTVITTEIDTPGRPAGDQIQYGAVAGDYIVSSTGGGKKAMTRLIDSAKAGGIKRKPLRNGLLGFMEFQFMPMLDAISPMGNPFEGDANAPQTLRLEFDSQSGTFHLALKFK